MGESASVLSRTIASLVRDLPRQICAELIC